MQQQENDVRSFLQTLGIAAGLFAFSIVGIKELRMKAQKDYLLSQHDAIDYAHNMLQKNQEKKFLSAEEQKHWQDELQNGWIAHQKEQKRPVDCFILPREIVRCPWCVEMAHEQNQR